MSRGRPPWASRALLLALALPCARCDDEPQLGRVAPELAVAPDRLDFGDVPLAATRRLEVELSNLGNATLNVTGLDASPPFLVDDAAFALLPGDTRRLAVGFRPTNDEPQQGSLQISSDDPDRAMLQIPLTGRGAEGNLTVTPTEVRFEGTKVGTTRGVDLILENVGLDAVEGLVRTDTFAQPEHFALSSVPEFASGGRFSVPARTQQILELRYQPQSAGAHGGRLVFEICGAGCGVEVDVAASADVSAVRLEPPVLDFGAVGISDTATELLRVTNGGDAAIEVLEVRTLGSSDVTVAATRSLPASVAPGDGLGLNVELRPTTARPIEAEVVVEVGPVQETLRATVIGQGEGPRFEVQPERVDFGVERGPGTYQRAVLLLNAGSSRVTVQGLALNGDGAFALGPLPTLPTGLGPGESLVVDVRFSPTMIAEYASTLRITSDDPLLPQLDVPVTGGLSDRVCELDLQPGRVNFGLLPPGFDRTLSATLRNVGSDGCEILSGDFRAPVDPAITLLSAPWPLALGPGDALQLDFAYAPVIQADSKATYIMQTSDPVFPERSLAIFGTSTADLDVFAVPPSVDFGASRLGCTAVTREVAIVNAGTIDVTIGGFALTASTAELSVANAPTPPVLLPAGVTRAFDVRYAPTDIGRDEGFVEVDIQDFGFAITVPLEGRGANDPRNVDTFEQASNDVVDVLFVVDDSCSMGDDQRALASNFRAFIQQADLRQVQFQIGVTTTTLFPFPGHIVGPIMTPATPNLEEVFRDTVNVGTSGSGFERGMEAMLGVLQAADRGTVPQAQLLRGGATRVVIFVSDEDDQSPSTVANYFQELRTRAPEGFTIAAVTGQSTGCQSAVAGRRYEDLVALGNGVSASICSAWSQTLSRIGQVAFGLRSRFFLSREADPSRPISVFVDGQLRSQGVQYDGADNAIVFDTPPREGAEIRVEYTPSC